MNDTRISYASSAHLAPAFREPCGVATGAWQADIARAVAEFRAQMGREPIVLDWHTGLNLASAIPGYTLFVPVAATDTLPYLNRTVDIVVLGDESPHRLLEARRVAHASLVVHADGQFCRPQANGKARGALQWHTRARRVGLPTSSIVIPCHNGAKVTEACLTALAETVPTSLSAEIIVVDDASTDATAGMLRRRATLDERIRVLRNRRNAGFIAACNRGARAARGEILVFLNNDTIPRPDWLVALLRTFRDRKVGAAGGKLIYPDGRLQEAGGVIFSNASGANFGCGDENPHDPLYSFVREVDYCSGALLATLRSLFLETGGFDRRYRPAYYEDADYCFTVRQRGYKVCYQPECEVMHVEGASYGAKVPGVGNRHQSVNRDKFMARWRAELAAAAPAPGHYHRGTWHDLAYRSQASGAAE